MKHQELKIYNSLIELLFNLEEEGYYIRENIVNFVITSSLNNNLILNDPKVDERLSLLVDSSNIAVTSLEIISSSLEEEFEREDNTNLGRNYTNSLLIENLYIAHDKYLALLGNYCIYKLENYHFKYLEENRLESIIIEQEIKEKDKLLVKNFDLKILRK